MYRSRMSVAVFLSAAVWLGVVPYGLSDVVTLEDYGGGTSKTAAQNKTAWDDAVSALSSGGVIQLGTGTYNIDLPLVLDPGVSVHGNGADATELKVSGSNTGDNGIEILDPNGISTDPPAGLCVLEDFKLTGNWDGSTLPTAFGHGVYIDHAVQVRMERVTVHKFTGSGLLNYRVGYSKFYFCQFLGNGLDGVWNLGGDLEEGERVCTVLVFIGNTIQGNRRSNIRHEEMCLSIDYFNNVINSSPIAFRATGKNACESNRLVGNHIENITGDHDFWLTANAPLDGDGGGAYGVCTGASLTVVGNFIGIDSLENIRANSLNWSASSSGTNEYYLASNVNEPHGVFEGGRGTFLDRNAPGFLQKSQWGWGDKDSLGYNTIYVRLVDGVDPDTKADGFLRAGATYAIPTGQAAIRSVYVASNGQFATPLPMQTTSDDFHGRDASDHFAARAYLPYGNVQRVLSENLAVNLHAGQAQAAVRAWNASGYAEEAYLRINGGARMWRLGSDTIDAGLEGYSTGVIKIDDGVDLILQGDGAFKLDEVVIKAGTDSPNGVIAAPVGSLYLQTNGGAGSTLYVKESGTGATGWIAK